MKGKFNHLYKRQCDCDEARPYRLEIDIDTKTATSLGFYILKGELDEIEFSVGISPSVKSLIHAFDSYAIIPTRLGFDKLKKYCCGSRKQESDMKVIFNEPATILYRNGKKYVSKCDKEDKFSEELGLALCLLKSFGVSYSDFEKLLKGAKRQGWKDDNNASK